MASMVKEMIFESWGPLLCLQSVTKRIKKGFVTKRDMQRLKNEVCPCSLEQGTKKYTMECTPAIGQKISDENDFHLTLKNQSQSIQPG